MDILVDGGSSYPSAVYYSMSGYTGPTDQMNLSVNGYSVFGNGKIEGVAIQRIVAFVNLAYVPQSRSIVVALGGSNCAAGGASSGLQNSNRRNCDDPLEEETETDCSEADCRTDRSSEQIAGANLLSPHIGAVPVVAENGFTDYVFAHAQAQTPNPEPWIGDPIYVFGSSDIPFTQFGIVDALPGGDDEFQIMFNGMTHTFHAGTEFIFTDFVPGGVQKFYVTGFDPAEMLDRTAAPTFRHAFKFAEEGVTYVAVGAIAPGNYDLTGNVDAADYELWKSTFGSTTDLRADGNQDGLINAADYTVWRDWLGVGATPSSGSGSLARVPEPTTMVLLAAGIALIGITTRRRR
jgi:hypothetical protein